MLPNLLPVQPLQLALLQIYEVIYRIKLSILLHLYREISEELQAIEEESTKYEHDSEATQGSDLQQEDSNDYLMDGEQ